MASERASEPTGQSIIVDGREWWLVAGGWWLVAGALTGMGAGAHWFLVLFSTSFAKGCLLGDCRDLGKCTFASSLRWSGMIRERKSHRDDGQGATTRGLVLDCSDDCSESDSYR